MLWVRRGVSVPLALIGFPLLLLYAYVLLYWSPALTGPGPDACDPATMGGACWRPEQRTFWIVGAAAAVPAALCLVLMVRRMRDAGRWWPWPVAAVVLGIVAGWAIGRIP
jgi:hypothetical protein